MSVLRSEAEAAVLPVTFMVGKFRAVQRTDAANLLGGDYAKLTKDKIRNLGPTPETLYPWNVIDYLQKRA